MSFSGPHQPINAGTLGNLVSIDVGRASQISEPIGRHVSLPLEILQQIISHDYVKPNKTWRVEPLNPLVNHMRVSKEWYRATHPLLLHQIALGHIPVDSTAVGTMRSTNDDKLEHDTIENLRSHQKAIKIVKLTAGHPKILPTFQKKRFPLLDLQCRWLWYIAPECLEELIVEVEPYEGAPDMSQNPETQDVICATQITAFLRKLFEPSSDTWMNSLKRLTLKGNRWNVALHVSLSKPSSLNLQEFNINGWTHEHHLSENLLPHNLVKLSTIRDADLTNLTNLKELCLKQTWTQSTSTQAMDNLWTVPTLPATLEILDLANCNVRNVGDLTYLKDLRELSLFDNRIGGHLDPGHLPRTLVKLNLRSSRLSSTGDLNGLTCLKLLDLGLNPLQNIDPKLLPPSLETLDLQSASLQYIGDMTHLVHLQTLILSCNEISLRWRSTHLPKPKLRKLGLRLCGLTYSGDLSEHTALEELYLSQNRSIRWNSRHMPTSLIRLDLTDCSLPKLGSLLHLRALQHLFLDDLHNRSGAIQWSPDQLPLRLRNLSIGNRTITIQDFTRLRALRRLNFHGSSFTTRSGVHLPTSLVILDLSACKLNVVTDLTHLMYLRELDISYNCRLNGDWSRRLPASLESLKCTDCNLDRVYNLRHLTKLSTLDIGGNPIGVRWTPEHIPNSVERLSMHRCQIRKTGQLRHLIRLLRLILTNNPRIEVEALNLPPDLVFLDLRNCAVQEPAPLHHLIHLKQLQL